MKKYVLFLILLRITFYSVSAENFKPHKGDLIFLQSQNGSLSQAISKVTTSTRGYSFTHVGMVYIDKRGTIWVLEAIPPKVKLTPLYQFLYPGNEEKTSQVCVVGRLRKKYRKLIPPALTYGLSLLNKGYDYGFVLGNDKYYCSELIYETLKKANGGKPVFRLNTMTFKDKKTGKIEKGWMEYFKKHGGKIPEGQAGINPGAMSRQKDIIKIVHVFQTPPKGTRTSSNGS